MSDAGSLVPPHVRRSAGLRMCGAHGSSCSTSLEGTTIMRLLRIIGFAFTFGAHWLAFTPWDNVGQRDEASGSIR